MIEIMSILSRGSRALYWLAVILAAGLIGCDGAPTNDRAAADLRSTILKQVGDSVRVIVDRAGPGEGDADNVYMHVSFRLQAAHDTILPNGCFNGLKLVAGSPSPQFQAVLLYQDTSGSPWALTAVDLPCRK
jgi:hypothetical protein